METINKIFEIKSRITVPEILRYYGIEPDSHNRIACPLHGGHDNNCGVKDEYIHCFVCGKSADQIGIVQAIFNISFSDAIKKIDSDFELNLFKKMSFEQVRRSRYERMAFQAKRDREKYIADQADREYWKAFDEWKRLDDNRRRFKPASPDEKLHPLFVESLQKRDFQKYILDSLETRRNRNV